VLLLFFIAEKSFKKWWVICPDPSAGLLPPHQVWVYGCPSWYSQGIEAVALPTGRGWPRANNSLDALCTHCRVHTVVNLVSSVLCCKQIQDDRGQIAPHLQGYIIFWIILIRGCNLAFHMRVKPCIKFLQCLCYTCGTFIFQRHLKLFKYVNVFLWLQCPPLTFFLHDN